MYLNLGDVCVVQEVPTEASEALSDARTPDDATTASWSTIPSRSGGLSARSQVTESPGAGRRRPAAPPSTSMKIEKNQAEWRRRRQQWSQQGRDVASVREDPTTDHPPPPARLNRSVDFELGGGRATTEEVAAAPPAAHNSQQSSKSFLGRSGNLSCRVLLLDGDELTLQVEVEKSIQHR